MTFLAQYRFEESRDIVGDLPGNILLIFIEDDKAWQPNPGQPDTFTYEWYELGLADLVPPSHVPTPYWPFFVGYGVRHRSVAYTNVYREDEWQRVLSKEILDGLPLPMAIQQFCCVNGIKIGGLPCWSYPDHITSGNGYELPGRFLCSLCAIYPGVGNYPWLNVALPMSDDVARERHNSLDFSDGFVINWFIDDQGRLYRGFQAS